MRSLKKTVLKVAFGLSPLVFGISAWMAHRPAEAPVQSIYPGYDRRLPPKLVRAMERLDDELSRCHGLIHAGSERVRFIDKDEVVKEYRYAFETLWCNDFPIVSNVQDFQFEYRNGNGSLLTRAARDLSCVDSIAYTIRLTRANRNIYTQSRVSLPVRRSNGERTVQRKSLAILK